MFFDYPGSTSYSGPGSVSCCAFFLGCPSNTPAFDSDKHSSSVTECHLPSTVTYFVGDKCLFPTPNAKSQMRGLCWGERSHAFPQVWKQWGAGQLAGNSFQNIPPGWYVTSRSEGGVPSAISTAFNFINGLDSLWSFKNIANIYKIRDDSTMKSYISVIGIQKSLRIWFISSIYNETYLNQFLSILHSSPTNFIIFL